MQSATFAARASFALVLSRVVLVLCRIVLMFLMFYSCCTRVVSCCIRVVSCCTRVVSCCVVSSRVVTRVVFQTRSINTVKYRWELVCMYKNIAIELLKKFFLKKVSFAVMKLCNILRNVLSVFSVPNNLYQISYKSNDVKGLVPKAL